MTWVINNCFYLIDYIKSENEWDVNIDIKHMGRRGGSIRTRYYGVLEGIDPKLKENFYQKLSSEGKSRVEIIEYLINSYINK